MTTRKIAEPKVTRETIIAATIEYVDRNGLDSLTMRVLADELGVFPTSLYWHVGKKGQLLSSAASHLMGEADLDSSQDVSWQDWLRTTARERRRILHAHPHFAAIIAGQLSTEIEASLPVIERTLVVLARAGFTGDALVHAYNAFAAGIVGWVNVELCVEPPEVDLAWQSQAEDRLTGLSADDYPEVHRNATHLANRAFGLRWQSGTQNPLDASFEFFVDTLIAGLERARSVDDAAVSSTRS